MSSDNRRLRQAVFQSLGWINAIVFSAAIVWAAGLPLTDLKRLALADPWPREATGTLTVSSGGGGAAAPLGLLEHGNVWSVYRCDLPGWWTTACLPEGASLPVGPARIEYVNMPEGTGSSAHRMPVRVTVGDSVVYQRSYAEAVSAARDRCLEVGAAGVGLWLVANLALSLAWKRGQKARG